MPSRFGGIERADGFDSKRRQQIGREISLLCFDVWEEAGRSCTSRAGFENSIAEPVFVLTPVLLKIGSCCYE